MFRVENNHSDKERVKKLFGNTGKYVSSTSSSKVNQMKTQHQALNLVLVVLYKY